MCEKDALEAVHTVFPIGPTPRAKRKRKPWQTTPIIWIEAYRQRYNLQQSNGRTPIQIEDVPTKNMSRARRRWARERGIKWVYNNHVFVRLNVQWAHEDQETYSNIRTPESIRRGLSAPQRAFAAPCPCSNPSCCGNPRKRNRWSEGELTRAEKKDRLRVKEDLADYKIKDELDRIYDDYWSRPYSPMQDVWTDNHPDLTDDWGWGETDYKIMEQYRNK